MDAETKEYIDTELQCLRTELYEYIKGILHPAKPITEEQKQEIESSVDGN